MGEAPIRLRLCCLPSILLGACLLAAPRATIADEVTLTPSKDNTLYENANGLFSNGMGSYLYVGRNFQPTDFRRRGLLAFDLTGIPAGSTINSATLTLSMSRTQAGVKAVRVHRVTADWGEGNSNAGDDRGGDGTIPQPGDATWLHRFFVIGEMGDHWSTPGGDFVAQASGSTQVGALGLYTWGSSPGMVADVQSWVDQPAGNFGWILIGDETSQSSKRFGSRENVAATERPQLTVVFTPPPQVPTLSPAGLAVLVAAVAGAGGVLLLRRRRTAPA